jgi:hypothetical protein
MSIIRSTAALLLYLACCSPPPSDADADADADVNADADVAADADADTEADVDSDADADIDSDIDADSDSDTVSEADVDDDPETTGSRIDVLVALMSDPSTPAAAVRSAVHDVAWAEGWPLEEDGRWLFATEWADAPDPVSLVGDINGWSTSASPASQSPAGPFYFIEIDSGTFTAPAEGAKYKWWGSPDVWRAPPEARAYGYDEFGRFGWVRPSPVAPHIEQFPDMGSAFLELPRTIRAFLPAGFEPGSDAARHARVLFLHDGQNVFHPDAPWGGWQVDRALSEGGYDDVVALAVDSVEDRLDVYSHVADEGVGPGVGGHADEYLRMVREEVLPFFRDLYGVVVEGDSLMIAGSSMGGLISLYMVLTDPDGQACAAALSPTLSWGAIDPSLSGADAMVNLWPLAVGHGSTSISLDSGGGPGSGCLDRDGDGVIGDEPESDDGDNYCVTAQMRDVLEALGYEHGVDLWHWWEPDAPHNEAAWAARFPRILDDCAAGGWTAPAL